MRNFLTFLGETGKGKGLYRCACGETVEKRTSDVKANRQVSCGCASPRRMNTGKRKDPLYNIFYAHKLNKRWDNFEEFKAELGIPPYEGAWVIPVVPGTEISPGNVKWGDPVRRLHDHPQHRTDMHSKEFKENPEIQRLSKELYVLDEASDDTWILSLDHVTREAEKLRDPDTAIWQKNMERAAVDYAIEERKRQEAKAVESGRVSQTQVARLFRYQLVNSCAEVMKETHQTALQKGSGRHLAVIDPVLKRGIDYMTAAHVTVTVTMDNLGRGRAFSSSLTDIKTEIGRRIDHQAFLNMIEAHHPRDFEKISRWYLKNGEMGYVYKINNSRRTVQEKLTYPFLSNSDLLHIGDWAFTCLARLTKWFEQENVPNGQGAGKSGSKVKHGYTAYLKLSEEGIKHRQMLQEVADAAEWDSWAMVHPPLDWTPEERGGFLLRHPGSIADLIHNDKGTIPSQDAFEAINRQQRVPFKVNRFIYGVQRQLLGKHHDIGSFKSYEAESWVDENFPKFDPSVWELESRDPIRRKAIRELKRAHGEQKKAEKLAKNPYRVLKQAARFIDVDRIYFSCFFDSRLRIYTHAMGLTYQGSDYQKALLMFADGVKVTDSNREQVKRELLVSLANTWGEDKLTFDKRVEFALDLVKDLGYVAQDPLTTSAYTVWTKADEPFQFLALLREWFELMVWKTSDIARVPGGRDATNSGSQILGGMCRDGKTCFYTNVVPKWNGNVSDGPQDLYGVVAATARVYLKSDPWVSTNLARYSKEAQKKAEKEGRILGRTFVLNMDPDLIGRSHLKRLCMVDSYGGSWGSKNEYVSAELDDTAKQEDIKITLAEKRLVTDAGIQAQAREFPLSTDLNKWFKVVGKSAVAKGLTFLEWETPDGSYIVQEYRVPNIVQVTTYAMGGGTYWQPLKYEENNVDSEGKRTRKTKRQAGRSTNSVIDGYTDDIMEGKTATALGANFTHSHDSCIIRGAMNHIDTPFFGVHDCIYGPHGSLEGACRQMRLAYYETVKGDALKGLVETNGLDVTPAPKGDVSDLSVCLDSPYMFS